MGVYRLPKDRPPPLPPRKFAPNGFGESYHWLCQRPLPYIDNYKTSSGVALYQVHPISERYDRARRPLPCVLSTRDPTGVWDRQLTTTALAHNSKQMTKDPATFAGNYPGLGSMKLVRKFDDHIKHRPHNQSNSCPQASVTASTFRRHDVLPTWGRVVDLSPAVECQPRSDGLDVQPAIPTEGGGFVRLLDPFVSTTTLDYHPYTARQQSDLVAKKDIITYWDAEGYPRAKGWGYGPRDSERVASVLSTRSNPIYDKALFAHRALHRRLPTRVTAVPHKGLQSEHQARFRQPLDDFVSHRWGTAVEYPVALYPNSLTELLTVPGMYCPESAHYGTRIPVNAMVDTGKGQMKLCPAFR